MTAPHSAGSTDIAIIGMSGRFPGARNIEQFWANLREGVESISYFSAQQLAAAGVDPALLNDPSYVPARGILEDAESFDAAFFGLSPREAETMDPQHRLFLECCWEALEHAGYDPERTTAAVGVFGGVGTNTYLLNNLCSNPGVIRSVGEFQITIGNDKDFVATRVSYKMNLKGPSVAVQTACSTSLVAVCQACQSLLSGECDIALAGASSVSAPQLAGYRHQTGGITSPDGHCRAFDAAAQGTVFSNGAGIVALKRLDEALADGDCIHAVIKGAAVNNDGALKAGYTAPSIEGQAAVIRTAQMLAETRPDTISYVETHGTATALGDPIEIEALTEAFRAGTDKKGFCAIGSVKTNIGHTDAAAGIAGLIKTVLMLKHRQIPPSLHFTQPNPHIDFANSPFFVNAKLADWRSDGRPRRAGVSSFGIGGTNAHIVVEEAPPRKRSGRSRAWKLLTLSAMSDTALDQTANSLIVHLRQHPDLDLSDVACTLRTGRKVFPHRGAAVCRDGPDAVSVLETRNPERLMSAYVEAGARQVVFLFSGQGTQYVDMGRDLYRTERVFRDEFDRCSEVLKPHLPGDLRDIVYPGRAAREQASLLMNQTRYTQPALFVLEYALARLWMSWGISPGALAGHSIGEYVAACLSGVFSVEDGLALVAERARLMQELPTGSMLAVPLSENEIRPYLNTGLSLAVMNSPSLCVVSGENEQIEGLRAELAGRQCLCRLLHTSHAFHSHMMDPVIPSFLEAAGRVRLNAPRIPFVSNVTGGWITPEEAADPGYWARHLRSTVRFSDCLDELLKEPAGVFLEVGPGPSCAILLAQQPRRTREHVLLSSIRHVKERRSDAEFILNSLGRLWLAGIDPDWRAFDAGERRHRLPLPTYPFERKRHWIEPGPRIPVTAASAGPDAAARPMLSTGDKRTARPRRSAEDIERAVVAIWRELLGVERIGLQDNFFELGGTSLIALRMISQVEHAFQAKLPLSVFKAPTVAQLVDYLKEDVPPAPHPSGWTPELPRPDTDLPGCSISA